MKKIYSKKIGLIVALASVLVGLVGLVFTSYKIYAANLTAGPLAISYSGDQLFNESNIKPGDIFIKDVSVKNNGTLPHSFSISASGVSGSLATVLQIEPREGGSAIWNQTLSGLASLPNGTKTIISEIAPGATRNLQIAAIFPSSAGNDIQGQATTSFNFNMGTESTDQVEPSGFSSPPASLNQRVRTAITYNPPASSQTENSVSTTPSGTGNQVAGASTVAGATTVAKELCFWWLVALIILIIFLILYHRYQAKEGKVVVWWLWPILFSGVLYVAHYFIDRSYQQTIFCHWFWAIEIITLIVYFIIDSRTQAE
ncbi:MAG: TasA family protein [Candidatus Berkelbacteria bacterium]